ncbi:hypothetical protein JXL19_00315 [bacterium]|nr:hypothetical protein [bacterium]
MIDSLRWKNKFQRGKKILGLAIEEKCIFASEMHHDGEGYRVKNVAQMDFSETLSFDKPDKLGESLAQFIRENKLSAKRAVIGLPARWLMIRQKTMPPSTGESVAGILRIHAEHEFSINPDELVIDYTGNVASDRSSQLSLGAVLRRKLNSVLGTMRAAGLKAISVTASSITLRILICKKTGMPFPDYFLCIRSEYSEFLVGKNEQVVDIKHIPGSISTGADHLISELRRIVSLCGAGENAGEKRTLMILDLSDSDEQRLPEIIKSLSTLVDVTTCDIKAVLKKMDISQVSSRKKFLPSTALVQAFDIRDSFYPDFANSRMNEKVVRIKKNQVIWASAIALCLIIFVLNMIFTWKSDKKDIAEMKLKLAEMSTDVKSAQDIVQKAGYARKWYSDRPEILRCLYELTMAFPVEGSIWATNFALNEDMKGIVSGRAVNEKSVVEVLDSIKASNLFSDVQMIYLRESGQSSQEVSFSMSFSFGNKGL